ncbi:uncharacterized protein LOC135808857 isoform X2 [Sycon ciliatum]|uniref:uncharacterized protein LOC135808857 isoform X2 n=1 Tax=Sycon ciliatum TaxID=27933 RepID=UPI0031F61A3E
MQTTNKAASAPSSDPSVALVAEKEKKTSKVQMVAEILSTAGNAFGRLSTMVMELQPEEELMSSTSGTRWTDAEVKRLHAAIAMFNNDLSKISNAVKTRSIAQVKAKMKKDSEKNSQTKSTSSTSDTVSTHAQPSSTNATTTTASARSSTASSPATSVAASAVSAASAVPSSLVASSIAPLSASKSSVPSVTSLSTTGLSSVASSGASLSPLAVGLSTVTATTAVASPLPTVSNGATVLSVQTTAPPPAAATPVFPPVCNNVTNALSSSVVMSSAQAAMSPAPPAAAAAHIFPPGSDSVTDALMAAGAVVPPTVDTASLLVGSNLSAAVAPHSSALLPDALSTAGLDTSLSYVASGLVSGVSTTVLDTSLSSISPNLVSAMMASPTPMDTSVSLLDAVASLPSVDSVPTSNVPLSDALNAVISSTLSSLGSCDASVQSPFTASGELIPAKVTTSDVEAAAIEVSNMLDAVSQPLVVPTSVPLPLIPDLPVPDVGTTEVTISSGTNSLVTSEALIAAGPQVPIATGSSVAAVTIESQVQLSDTVLTTDADLMLAVEPTAKRPLADPSIVPTTMDMS